jgi:hypothetical protein
MEVLRILRQARFRLAITTLACFVTRLVPALVYSAKDYPSLNFAAEKLSWRYCDLRTSLSSTVSRGSIEGPAAPTLKLVAPAVCRACGEIILSVPQFFSTRRANRSEWWYRLRLCWPGPPLTIRALKAPSLLRLVTVPDRLFVICKRCIIQSANTESVMTSKETGNPQCETLRCHCPSSPLPAAYACLVVRS